MSESESESNLLAKLVDTNKEYVQNKKTKDGSLSSAMEEMSSAIIRSMYFK